MSKPEIEIFQDLVLTIGAGGLPAIRDSLLKHQTDTWIHAATQEAKARKYGGSDEDIVVFRHDGSSLPTAGLTLWEQAGEYAVTNIVPMDKSELSVEEYNSLLQNFVRDVVRPAQSDSDFKMELTDPVRCLDGWISSDAAKALQTFSALANKSTTNSHPHDAARWEQFVVAVHLEKPDLDTELLAKWLIEAYEWDAQSAHKLARDYEKGLSLLETYDRLTQG